MKKLILAIIDDKRTASSIVEALGAKYELRVVPSLAEAKEWQTKHAADLVIIDFDLKESDGLQIYKKLNSASVTIMLSSSGSVPLAVSATKSGISDFLRKPIQAEQLQNVVKKSIQQPVVKLSYSHQDSWLAGLSSKMVEVRGQIKKAILENKDIVLIAEPGLSRSAIAEFVHRNSSQKERLFKRIDLHSYRGEILEANFWMTMQEILALPARTSVQGAGDRCGTLYLANLESVDEYFVLSILKFLSEKGSKIDKSIRLILGVRSRRLFEKLKLPNLIFVEVPALRERREDIGPLLHLYLSRYSAAYGRETNLISKSVLDFLSKYDFPGNIVQLERMIETAILSAPGQTLGLANLPLSLNDLEETVLNDSVHSESQLFEAVSSLERCLIKTLLEKSNNNLSVVAKFFDLPQGVLADRLESLNYPRELV